MKLRGPQAAVRARVSSAQHAINVREPPRFADSFVANSLRTVAWESRMRTESGGYRRDHLAPRPACRSGCERKVRIMGRKAYCCARLVAASSAKTASFSVPSFVPKWRARGRFELRDRQVRKLLRIADFKGLSWKICRRGRSGQRTTSRRSRTVAGFLWASRALRVVGRPSPVG
jgi:hypothetical protein